MHVVGVNGALRPLLRPALECHHRPSRLSHTPPPPLSPSTHTDPCLATVLLMSSQRRRTMNNVAALTRRSWRATSTATRHDVFRGSGRRPSGLYRRHRPRPSDTPGGRCMMTVEEAQHHLRKTSQCQPTAACRLGGCPTSTTSQRRRLSRGRHDYIQTL